MNTRHETIDRRRFFGKAAVAAGGLALSGCASGLALKNRPSSGGKNQRITGNSIVSLEKNSDRRQATYNSLKPLQNDVAKAIGEKQVIIKVNAGFPTESHRIHSTYPDQVRGILDFLAEFYEGNIWIAEGVGSSKTGNMSDGYDLYGITQVSKEYADIRLVDANRTPFQRKWIRHAKQHPQPINIISMYFDPSNFVISAARLKTHNAVVGTFSLKNIVMGSPVGRHANVASEKSKMHGFNQQEPSSGRELSYNMFRLVMEGVYPDLAVVDGITGIEGDGPWDGTEVDHNISVASTDFVACDRICTELVGIDPFYMKYVEWCGEAELGNWNRDKIKVIGSDPKQNAITYKLNKNYEQQVAWIDRNFTRG